MRFDFPVSAKKLALILLVVFLLIVVGIGGIVAVLKMQERDPMHVLSDRDALGVILLRNTPQTQEQFVKFMHTYTVPDSLTSSLWGLSSGDSQSLLQKFPQEILLIAYKEGITGAFSLDSEVHKKQLVEKLKIHFSVLEKDSVVLFSAMPQEILESKWYVKDSTNKKLSDVFHKKFFDGESLLSFELREGMGLVSLLQLIPALEKDQLYSLIGRDVLSQFDKPMGNMSITPEGFVKFRGNMQADKNDMEYLVSRKKLDLNLLSVIPYSASFIAFPVGENMLVQWETFLKERKGSEVSTQWKYIVQAFEESMPLISNFTETMKGLEGSQVALGMNGSGALLVGFKGITSEQIKNLTESLFSAAKEHLAYVETPVTLPDKSKTLMLTKDPSSLTFETLGSGDIIRTLKLQEKELVKIFEKEDALLLATPEETYKPMADKKQSEFVKRYFPENIHLLARITLHLELEEFIQKRVLPQSKLPSKHGNLYMSMTAFPDSMEYQILFAPQ